MQEDTQKTKESTSQSGAVIYHDESPQKKRRWPIFAAISIVIIIICVAVIALLQKPKEKETNTINADRSITYTYEESSFAEAYGNLLSAAVESYKVGGNKNGVKVEGRGHYPTQEQVKNKEWTQKNLKLNDDVVNLIEKGTLSYTASGCEQEKCTVYVIKAGDKEVTKNLN